MKKQITYREAQIIDNVISNYFVNNGYWDKEKNEFTKVPYTVLATNMKNVKKQCEKIFEEFLSKKDDLQLDNCATDEKTKVILLRDVVGKDGQITQTRQYTVDGEKKLNIEVKALLATSVDIHIRITEDFGNLTDEQKEIFSGILIPELPAQITAEPTTE